MYYGARLFEQAGIEDPLQTQLILGAVNVAMTFYGLYVVEKFGRRWPLFIGALWQATWLLIYAAVAVALPPTENEAAGIMLIVATCLFIASFAGTWGPMAWVVIGETFPQRTRAKQASLATAGNWLGNCKSTCFVPNLILINSHGGFPHPIGKRRYRLQLWIRFRRLQHCHSIYSLVLPLRDRRSIPRKCRSDVLSTGT
jgi:MFS family permease